jgi:predicted ATPase
MASVSTTESDEAVDELAAKPPFLRRVRIRGYKSIAFCDVTLEPLTILVGRNASGKSNFLDALAFLRDVMALGVTEAVKRRGGWSMIACRTLPTRRIEIALEAGFVVSNLYEGVVRNGLSDAASPHQDGQSFTSKYQLEVSTNSLSIPVIDRETLEITDSFDQLAARFTRLGDRFDFKKEDMTEVVKASLTDWINRTPQVFDLFVNPEHPLLGVIGAQPISAMWSGVRHMAFYNFLPAAMRPVQQLMHGQMLDQHGSNLASVLADIGRTERWAFERIGQYLSAVVPQIESFAPVQYGEYETTRFRLSSPSPDKTLEFDAASMSDGTLRVLAALTAVFQNVPPYGYPSVVGIEEPESALHPAAMRALVAALDEATLRMQVLLTTHSPDLLDMEEVKPENIRVVQMINGQTVIGPADEANMEVVGRKLNTLGGLERDDHLEPDLDDRNRQQLLQEAREGSPA